MEGQDQIREIMRTLGYTAVVHWRSSMTPLTVLEWLPEQGIGAVEKGRLENMLNGDPKLPPDKTHDAASIEVTQVLESGAGLSAIVSLSDLIGQEQTKALAQAV